MIERLFAGRLEKIAEYVGRIVNHYSDAVTDTESLSGLISLLHAYSQALRPWAKFTSAQMLGEVNRRDAQTWHQLARGMAVQIRHDIANTPVGGVIARLMAEQTDLITSLPIEAAQRVQRLALEARISGKRAEDIAQEIERTGEVSASRARAIARTEVARAASNLLEARSLSAGATHYVWHTQEDADVRPGHSLMDGKVCAWASPPEVREGDRVVNHHPGRVWNCRCWASPIIPEDLGV